MPDLLRYQAIAVLQYSFTPDALFLRHPQQLQNLGSILKIVKKKVFFYRRS
jgi:hypothetical protein